MSSNEWLKDIKAGDTVYIQSRYRVRTGVVVKTTNTQIVVGGARFRKSDGCEIRAGYKRSFRDHLIPEDQASGLIAEEKREMEMRGLRARIQAFNLVHLTEEQLLSIISVIEERTDKP